MTQGFWKVYKTKALQALGGELQEEDLQDERETPELMETTDPILLKEEGPSPVSQLARKVQGAGVKGWRTVASLFARENEHQLLAPEPCADHPLAVKPADEPPSAENKTSGLWHVFVTKWQQTAAPERMAAATDSMEPTVEGRGVSGETPTEEANGCDDSDLREADGVAFKWSYLTSKLAELKTKNIPKSN